MNTPLDRDALARRVFDAVICDPKSRPIEALQDWLELIAGAGGYLSASAECLSSDYLPLPSHLAGIGSAIEKAAKIARFLANETESELIRLAIQDNGQGTRGAA